MKKVSAFLGIAAGILAIVFAIILFDSSAGSGGIYLPSDTGTRTSYEYYGGDAYTGMQQASADAARNVQKQSEIIIAGFRGIAGIIPNDSLPFGAILLCMGLGMIAFFSNKLCEMKAKEAFEEKLLSALSDIKTAEQPLSEVQTVFDAEAAAEEA